MKNVEIDNEKLARKHPDWCNYPVTGEGHPVIDMCWSFMSGEINYETDCKRCDFYKFFKPPQETNQ